MKVKRRISNTYMAFLDRFRKQKKERKPTVSTDEPKRDKEQKTALPSDAPKSRKVRKKGVSESSRILKFPRITEKATDLVKKNQYIFEVLPRANKIQIKKAVEELYKVDVLSVRTINIPPKRKMMGRIEGKKKGYKKAIVKIKEGQKIPILPG